MGKFNSFVKFFFKNSDDQGVDILWHWLYGKGKLLKFDYNENWSAYMMANELLTKSIKDILVPLGNKLKNGQSIKYDSGNIFMEVENGESINGYMFLHGTLFFRMVGTISKDMNGNVTYYNGSHNSDKKT
jgi:hypothetical protein